LSGRRYLIVTALTAALVAGCAANPQDSSSGEGHASAAKTHREFARDYENAGNDTQAQEHARKAEQEMQQKADEECNLLCAIIDSLFSGPRTEIPGPGSSCRDPVTTSPAVDPRC
jgi:hypothetical protein